METSKRRYPEQNERELSAEEKERLREKIAQGEGDLGQLAREFGCRSSQVAGVKAAMSR